MILRAPQPDEATAVFAVLAARDVADLGVSDYTLEDVRDEWRATDFDLAADAVVAEIGSGELAAYAAVRPFGTEAVVAPDHEGRGIGTRLLAWAERRERELDLSRHRQWIAGPNGRGAEFLRGAGYAAERSYFRLGLSLDGHGTPASPPPSGITFSPLSVHHEGIDLHALSEAAFATTADHEPETLETFREEHIQVHDLAPELSCIAERDGVPVGFLLARRREGSIGHVDLLGVDPAYRTQGLATAMLGAAFAAFAAAGLREATLGVASDNPPALRLYERCGMTEVFRLDTYVKPV